MDEFTLDEIESEQSRTKACLKFRAKLEKLYRIETVSRECKSVAVSFVFAVMLCNIFILSDYFVADSDFFLYAFSRLVLLTPVCLLLSYLLYKNKAPYDVLVCLIPCWMTAIFSALLMMSHGGYRSNYLFGDILVIICGCIVGRPQLFPAVLSVSFQCVCYHIVLFASNVVVPRNRGFSSLFCLSGAALALLTLYMLEVAARRAFLSSAQARLFSSQLEVLTMTDPLTGIGNRRAFEESTQRFWKKAPGDTTVSIILIDIDNFKLFNDRQGHSAGDVCLKTIATRIAEQVRVTDPSIDGYLAARFGGEEFIVFLPCADVRASRQIAESIRLAVCDAQIPHPVNTACPLVSVSLGVATSQLNDCSVADLINRADMALYAAKRNGRNQIWPPLASADKAPDCMTEIPVRPAA